MWLTTLGRATANRLRSRSPMPGRATLPNLSATLMLMVTGIVASCHVVGTAI